MCQIWKGILAVKVAVVTNDIEGGTINGGAVSSGIMAGKVGKKYVFWSGYI